MHVHGHAGHSTHVAPPSPLFFPGHGHLAKTRHRTTLAPPTLAVVEEEAAARWRSRAQIDPACRSRCTRAHHGQHWPPAASPAQAPPGPSLYALSITVTARSRRTRARHKPWTAATGDDEQIPPLLRQTRKQREQTRRRPNALSLPNASSGTAEQSCAIA
jgi:hypothetical protein